MIDSQERKTLERMMMDAVMRGAWGEYFKIIDRLWVLQGKRSVADKLNDR